MANTIRIKRGLKANLPALLAGELAYCNDTLELFVGRVNPGNGFTENILVNDIPDISGILTSGGYLDSDDFASQTEAEVGTSETTIMSPLRTRESITEILADKTQAEAGLVNNRLMTPLRTAQAIDYLVDFDFGLILPPPDDPFNTPGATTFIASTESDGEVAGFFGQVTQEDFGITMTQVMSDLGISQGTAQNTSDDLLKFIHRGKIKFINRRTIRYSTSWNHIQARLEANSGNLYGGATLTFGGHSYKVRLMRGWGQVSANADGTGTPNYETGPLMTISFDIGTVGNSGVNWPTNTSGWSANNPNEWNTLMFPISSSTQSQTDDVPDWASYSDTDLQVTSASGNGRATWAQETNNTYTNARVARGIYDLAYVGQDYKGGDIYYSGLRLVFEHIGE